MNLIPPRLGPAAHADPADPGLRRRPRSAPTATARKRWTDWTPFTYPFNLTRQPAATVPCGLTKAGLPVGLQIVGALYDDALVLRAARAFERARPWPLPAV